MLETITPGADGRVLGDVSHVAEDFARQLDAGNAAYALPVEVTPAVMAASARMVEVDLSEQMLYMKENGAVVDSWPISSGIADS
ncbi:L,D-transpeptidase, partial [Streptomyces scabiei]|uniref:L,D-transpeptidase n=1 Tax=Streptomyces scabiei TaxID=1930 RepID=UPI0038F713FB